MIDVDFYKRMKANRPQIDKFWKERPKGLKLCPNCFLIFDTPGFPCVDSWSCSEWCFESTNIRHPIITQETPIDTTKFFNQIFDEMIFDKEYLEKEKD